MTSERKTVEWVEIIEPKTKEHMYANLTTGECVWDPPEGVPIKRTDNSQWWELFDSNTQRFYYYNVAAQTTVWHRPQNCDIIPLAKLQTLKQNTDPSERKDGFTQTKGKSSHRTSSGSINRTEKRSSASHPPPHSPSSSVGSLQQHQQRIQTGTSYDERKSSSDLLSSPLGRHSYRLPSDAREKYCRHSQNSANRSVAAGSSNGAVGGSSNVGYKNKESGKLSDSSLSSAQGYRRLNEGGSLRIGSAHSTKNKLLTADNNYRLLQESASSQNITHSPFGGNTLEKQRTSPQLHHGLHPKLSYSISNSSDLGAGLISPTRSANTPILKKKLASDNSIHGGVIKASNFSKHQSVDYPPTNPSSIVSLTRSGSFMSSPNASHNLNMQQSKHSSSYRKSSIDGHASDDSMHEKYFKSVENTPITRRRQTGSSKSSSNKKHSSDSSPQSPLSPQNHNTKSARPSVLSSLSALEPPIANYNLLPSHPKHTEFLNLDLDKMRLLDKHQQRSPGSCRTHSSHSPSGQDTFGSISRKGGSYMKTTPVSGGKLLQPNIAAASSSHSPNNVVTQRNPSNLEQYLSKTNIERHNKEIKNVEKSSVGGKRKPKRNYNSSSDVEYDNGNVSPLYSNWDQEMHEHLLPLQHYILEQAKLSGCYGFGDHFGDSDSFHSDSQSEQSLSGHEPDNEDSDHSEGHGDYLSHNYGLIDDYGGTNDGVSYYAYQFGFDKSDREDLSENVEAVLENERDNTQIYNNVPSPRNHHYHLSSPSPRNQQQQQLPPQHMQQFPPKIPDRDSSIQKAFTEKQNVMHHKSMDNKDLVDSTRKIENFSQQKKSQSFFSSITQKSGDGIHQLSCMKECDIEKFAQDNLNLHSKGIFRKKSSVRDMLSWTGDAISRPMLALARDKVGKKMATELFKLVQIYMGDRKARAGMSLNSVAIDIIVNALSQQQLRDELYVQLCRQTTENPKRDSLIRGWELMAICLSFVPPSPTFQPALLNYVNRHRDPTFATSFPEVGKWPIHVQISHYATICCRRLDRIGSSGRKQAKKPTDDEVEQARNQILRDSMFGNTLTEVIDLQKDKHPDRKLPWIQVTLSEQVLLLNGKQTEGIFRVSADVDEVNCLKSRLDRWEVPEHKNTMDAHAPASLLKLWYRELYDPLIPDEFYNECVQTDDPAESDKIINKLPPLNKLVLTYLINFLQEFTQPDVVNCTKMDSSNLAMVFAPNCLRCTSDDPKVILENARKEMGFLRTLIQHMDTSSVKNLI